MEKQLLSFGSGTVGIFLRSGFLKAEQGAATTQRLWSNLASLREALVGRLAIDQEERLNLLARLLRISGNIHIVPPRDHPLYHRPGPHDIAAMSVAGLLIDTPQLEANEFNARLRLTDGIFSAGSPINSILAATFIPASGDVVHKDIPLVVDRKVVPYHFFQGNSADLVIKSATQSGVTRPARNNGLVVGGINWFPQPLSERDGWLKTDFLLLTVLPWSSTGGGYIAFVSGGHGPGTGALKLLADPRAFPLADLEKLVDDLRDALAYQVVFEMDVVHTGLYSMPSSIRVSSQCPPRKIAELGSLFTVSDERLDHIVGAVMPKSEKGRADRDD